MKKINNILRLVLWIFVVPFLLTLVFSKFITSKNILVEHYSFTLQPIIANKIGLDCTLPQCGFKSEQIGLSSVSIFSNLAGYTTFQSDIQDVELLKQLQNQIKKQVEEFIRVKDCYSSPEKFATQLLIQNFQWDFLTTQVSQALYDFVYLARGDQNKILEKQSKPICDKYIESIRSPLISEVQPTYEQEYNKLRLVLLFYFGLTFLSVLAFYIYPYFKNRHN